MPRIPKSEAIMPLAFLLETDALHQPTEPGQAQQDRSRMAHVGTRSRTSVFTWQLRTVQGSEEAGERSEERHLPSQPMTKRKASPVPSEPRAETPSGRRLGADSHLL